MRPRYAATILLMLLGIVPARAADGSGHLWLGDVFLGDVGSPRPGLHVGQELSIGGIPYRAVWEAPASPGTGTWPALEFQGGPVPPPVAPPRMELIVLTTSDLALRSEQLGRFMDFRAAEGWQVTLLTDEQWDQPTTTEPDDIQARIRSYLADHYLDDPGAFLLLVGDPDPEGGDVPMRNVHPLSDVVHYYDDWLAEELDPMPTDFYYADLDGEWDCDGDGRLGEYPDDAGNGCVDFGPELYVGRLPVYDREVEDLDELLERILTHDLEMDKSYRANVLLPGALFGMSGAPSPTGGEYPENDDGACILATIHRDLPGEFDTTRLFEDGGLCTSPYPHEGPLEQTEVKERWADGRGMVIWAGHGSPNGAYRAMWTVDSNGDGDADDDECSYPPFMESSDAPDLAGVPGAFTFHISCDNGFPEITDNIGAELLYGGAVATATASRPAFGVTVPFGETWEPRPDLGTSSTCAYYYALGLANGMTAGEALAYTKYALPGDGWPAEYPGVDFTGAAWATRVEYNLYGDPTRSLELCEIDDDCDDGSPCNGTESCDDGFCVHRDPIDCGHLDEVCTAGSCDLATGECVSVARLDGTTCDDGLWCTESDECAIGICTGADRECGERDGYDVWCDEDADSCVFDEIEAAADDDDIETTGQGCECSTRPAPTAPFAFAIITAALLLRRRGSRDARGGDRT